MLVSEDVHFVTESNIRGKPREYCRNVLEMGSGNIGVVGEWWMTKVGEFWLLKPGFTSKRADKNLVTTAMVIPMGERVRMPWLGFGGIRHGRGGMYREQVTNWATSAVSLFVADHFGADAFVGVNFQEERVAELAVDDVNFADAFVEDCQAAFDFGNHAAFDGAGLNHLAGLPGGERMDEGVGIVFLLADAVDVAQENQLFGAERCGDGGGGGVGVDVQLFAGRGRCSSTE